MLGTRPIETMSRSTTSVCAAPWASVYSTRTSSALPFFSLVTLSILTPSEIFSPWRPKSFAASLAICSSTAPRNAGSASRTVTSAPRRRQTEPISRPITPAPMTPRRFGTSPIDSAPSLDRTRFSSNAAPGNARAFEPVATMTWRAISVSSADPPTLISTPASLRPTKEPRPWKNVTLFFLKRYRMPSLFCLTTLSLRPSIFARSSPRPLTSMPWAAKWWPACS